jgi:hypothetical protein
VGPPPPGGPTHVRSAVCEKRVLGHNISVGFVSTFLTLGFFSCTVAVRHWLEEHRASTRARTRSPTPSRGASHRTPRLRRATPPVYRDPARAPVRTSAKGESDDRATARSGRWALCPDRRHAQPNTRLSPWPPVLTTRQPDTACQITGRQAESKGMEMRHRSKLLLAGLTAALAFGALISTSSANRLARSHRGWRVTIKQKFIGFATVECRVTLGGSFHSRTISKILEALIGYVTRVTVDETRCTNGSARTFTETLPWHLRYGGFEGVLPIIVSRDLRYVGAAWLVQVGGIAPAKCLYKSSAASPMKAIENRNTATGVASSLRLDETAAIPFTSGTSSFACGNSGRVEGTSTALTDEETGEVIIVTLVA